jgi:hypothetical protein
MSKNNAHMYLTNRKFYKKLQTAQQTNRILMKHHGH